MNPTEVVKTMQNPVAQLQTTNRMQFVTKTNNYKRNRTTKRFYTQH